MGSGSPRGCARRAWNAPTVKNPPDTWARLRQYRPVWVYPLGIASTLFLGLTISWWLPVFIIAGSGVVLLVALVYATVVVRRRTRERPSI